MQKTLLTQLQKEILSNPGQKLKYNLMKAGLQSTFTFSTSHQPKEKLAEEEKGKEKEEEEEGDAIKHQELWR